jgi:gluconolactonase
MTEFEKLFGGAPKVEKIAGGYTVAAGPAHSRRGFLLFTDPPAERIWKWEDGEARIFREKSNGAVSLTFDHQGRLLASEKGRVTRTEKDGKGTVLAEGLAGAGDLVYAIDGGVYVTDPARSEVLLIPRGGTAGVASRACRAPSGLALAPNQQRLFVADAAAGEILVFPLAPDGKLGAPSRFASLGMETPAGLKTDEEGNIWLATGSGIAVWNAWWEGLGTVPVPEPCSNCGWGDGFGTLYVTAKTSVYRVATRVHGTRTY